MSTLADPSAKYTDPRDLYVYFLQTSDLAGINKQKEDACKRLRQHEEGIESAKECLIKIEYELIRRGIL